MYVPSRFAMDDVPTTHDSIERHSFATELLGKGNYFGM